LDKEAEDAYNERQRAPLFQNAKEMIPMEQVKQHFENLLCGYHHRYGCNLLIRDISFYACVYHQAMQATGTDFFWYYHLLTDNDLERMTAEQHTKLEQRRKYEQKWMDNFPKGAPSYPLK
jgi:hypothetical protein